MRSIRGTSIGDTDEPLPEGKGLIGKVKLAATLCGDQRLSAKQFRVAIALVLYFHNTGTGKCFPSYRQLADASCTSKTTAMRSTKKLKAMGVIEFQPNRGGRSRRNSYVFKTVAASDPLPLRNGVRSGSFQKPNGIVRGAETGSAADPHISNEKSNEVEGASLSNLNGLPQPEIGPHAKLSPDEIKRRDQRVHALKSKLAAATNQMMGGAVNGETSR